VFNDTIEGPTHTRRQWMWDYAAASGAWPGDLKKINSRHSPRSEGLARTKKTALAFPHFLVCVECLFFEVTGVTSPLRG
jgi:hypothetical protein